MPGSQPCPKCAAQVPAGSRHCQRCGSAVPAGQLRQGGQAKPARHSQTKTFLIGALALVLVIGAALTGIQLSRDFRIAAQEPQGTPHEIHGAGPMPNWLAMADPAIVKDYAWAAEHHDQLQYIPCYCGCGAQGHHNNSECYFRRDQSGAILEYDPHAYG